MLTEDRICTPEDLLALAEREHYELVDGHLVEKSMGALSDRVGARILIRVGSHADAHGIGCVFGPETGYRCFENAPQQVRKPDVSFIARERLDEAEIPEGHLTIAPDMAVESVSRHESFYEVLGKVGEYLSAGVRLVWLVVPRDRTVTVYRADGSVTWLRDGAEITGEEVLPGFHCSISEFFPPPARRANGASSSGAEAAA